ncbi:LysR family transcriptional regulator [Sphingomonas azotifigens]|uniref:LysR family transcriptional regulator n=1 Tax=Sphingomonas azotifigens TaxID=330920 RepID=UPI000A06E021|nr:LysR family transcriptional regulator [Sphingomonas azotifigens]
MNRPDQVSVPTETGTRLRRLNINLLYALDAILQSPTLTAAAHLIALSQPAVSAKLRQLREHFGDELVVYGEGRRLTALGEALRARTGRLLRELDDTFNLTLDFDPATATHIITIAAPEAIELMFLGRAIPDIRARAPGIQIRMLPFVHDSTRRLFDAGVDVAIVPEPMVDEGLCAQPLFRHRLTGLVCGRHRFAGQVINEEQYLAAAHAAVAEEVEKSMFGDYGPGHVLARRTVAVRSSLYSMLPLLALGSELVVTTSDWFAQHNAANLPMQLVELPFLDISSQAVVQWQPYRAREPMIQWLVEELKLAWAKIAQPVASRNRMAT